MPAVSILTPMKNAAPWVAATITSVRAQTFQDWEMLIIDDGSTDDSVAIATAAAGGDNRIRITSNTTQHHGAAGARNAALAQAQGRYIAFLDSDDLWDPIKLERQIGAMKAEGWCFCWTSYRVETEANRGADPASLPVRHALTQATRRDILAKRAPIGCLTAVYDRTMLGDMPMPTHLVTQEDFALWAKIAQQVETHQWGMGGIDTVLATYRLRGDSLSANKAKVALRHWSVLSKDCGEGPVQATLLFASYAWRGVRDRLAIRRTPRP